VSPRSPNGSSRRHNLTPAIDIEHPRDYGRIGRETPEAANVDPVEITSLDIPDLDPDYRACVLPFNELHKQLLIARKVGLCLRTHVYNKPLSVKKTFVLYRDQNDLWSIRLNTDSLLNPLFLFQGRMDTFLNTINQIEEIPNPTADAIALVNSHKFCKVKARLELDGSLGHTNPNILKDIDIAHEHIKALPERWAKMQKEAHQLMTELRAVFLYVPDSL
jgi:hypothetical protein